MLKNNHHSNLDIVRKALSSLYLGINTSDIITIYTEEVRRSGLDDHLGNRQNMLKHTGRCQFLPNEGTYKNGNTMKTQKNYISHNPKLIHKNQFMDSILFLKSQIKFALAVVATAVCGFPNKAFGE